MTSTAAKHRKIGEITAKAAEALGRAAYFEAERLAEKALAMARQEDDFERMIAIVQPLREARRRRFEQASDHGRVQFVTEPVVEGMKIKPGCYLVQPPQVGADARRLRLAALSQDVPAAVVCREPITRSGAVPVVAISPGGAIRARLEPPADPDAPTLEWFLAATEALGDAALEEIDPELTPVRRVDALLEALDAVPEHEALHGALAAACREAHHAAAAKSTTPKPSRNKIKSA